VAAGERTADFGARRRVQVPVYLGPLEECAGVSQSTKPLLGQEVVAPCVFLARPRSVTT